MTLSPERPRCGHPMRAYGLPGASACGRREGHPGRHISAASLRRRPAQAPTGSADVAAAIRAARAAAGLTQRRLAWLAGVTEQCVQRWEQAERTPAPESWEQLELTLGPLGIVRNPGPEAAGEQQRGESSRAA